MDNYIIHKSEKTRAWLKANPKFNVIYQLVCSSWVNHVERMWQALHDTTTRNHRYRSMWQILKKSTPFYGYRQSISGSKNMELQKCSGIRRSYIVQAIAP